MHNPFNKKSEKNMIDPYYYRCNVVRVIDGDTIVVDIDQGFDDWKHGQKLRLAGIDTPESRTRNLAEKALGLAAKERLKALCGDEVFIKSLGKGKYGRILAVLHTREGTNICDTLINEGHAVEYWGGKKTKVWA
jgi:micrococcal nuclease